MGQTRGTSTAQTGSIYIFRGALLGFQPGHFFQKSYPLAALTKPPPTNTMACVFQRSPPFQVGSQPLVIVSR